MCLKTEPGPAKNQARCSPGTLTRSFVINPEFHQRWGQAWLTSLGQSGTSSRTHRYHSRIRPTLGPSLAYKLEPCLATEPDPFMRIKHGPVLAFVPDPVMETEPAPVLATKRSLWLSIQTSTNAGAQPGLQGGPELFIVGSYRGQARARGTPSMGFRAICFNTAFHIMECCQLAAKHVSGCLTSPNNGLKQVFPTVTNTDAHLSPSKCRRKLYGYVTQKKISYITSMYGNHQIFSLKPYNFTLL